MPVRLVKPEAVEAAAADNRHLHQESYKLAAPAEVSAVKSKKGGGGGGRAAKKGSSKEKSGTKQQGKKSKAPPPGFSQKNRYPVTEKAKEEKADKKEEDETEDPVLVSYADGSNSLAAIKEVVNNLTVSCVVDACHVFLQQPGNLSFPHLETMQARMMEVYDMPSLPEVYRPVAVGSVLAVLDGDGAWYRCQVVNYSAINDVCDIRYVDYGGYTSVAAGQLRQLYPEFLALPFQSVECYAHGVGPAADDAGMDAATALLSQSPITIRPMDFANDGMPLMQVYYTDPADGSLKLYSEEALAAKAAELLEEAGSDSGESNSSGLAECWVPPGGGGGYIIPAYYYVPSAGGQLPIVYVPQQIPYAEEPQDDEEGLADQVKGDEEEEAVPGSDEGYQTSETGHSEPDELEKPYEDWTQEDYEKFYGYT